MFLAEARPNSDKGSREDRGAGQRVPDRKCGHPWWLAAGLDACCTKWSLDSSMMET